MALFEVVVCAGLPPPPLSWLALQWEEVWKRSLQCLPDGAWQELDYLYLAPLLTPGTMREGYTFKVKFTCLTRSYFDDSVFLKISFKTYRLTK